MPALGFLIHCSVPAAQIGPTARAAEEAGFDEAWVVEDLSYAGGIAGAALALGATREIGVGVGILPSVVRTPAFAAMDVSTLAGAHPGRLRVGVGHGVGRWMTQVGAAVESPLTALEEVVATVRDLLAGRTVTRRGRHVHHEGVALEQPPSMPPPILIGATGPRSIAVAGRAADGLILPEGCPPAFVAAARELLDAGAPAGRRPLLVTYVWLSLATDADAARDVLRPHVAERIARPDASRLLEPAGLAGPVAELFERVPPAERPGELPTAWIDGIAVVGDGEGAAACLQAYADAGADTIVLTPPEPADAEAQLAAAARDLVPLAR